MIGGGDLWTRCVVRRRRIDRRHWGGHQFPGARDIGFAGGARQQPIVANAMEALRQNVEQEAPDELVGAERHCAVPRLSVAAVILEPEGHAALVESNEATVRDGHAMGVAGSPVQVVDLSQRLAGVRLAYGGHVMPSGRLLMP
jgi:hypothetical protein